MSEKFNGVCRKIKHGLGIFFKDFISIVLASFILFIIINAVMLILELDMITIAEAISDACFLHIY